MGNQRSKSEKQLAHGPVTYDWDTGRRLTHREKCDFLQTLKNESEEYVIELIENNLHILSSVFWFEVYKEFRKTGDGSICSCSKDLELCQKDGVDRNEMLKRLEMAITSTKCPHVSFRDNDITFDVNEDISVQKWVSNCNVCMPLHNVCRHEQKATSGVHLIHLAIIFGKSEVVKHIFPIAIEHRAPVVTYQTLRHDFSPISVALAHQNLDVAMFLVITLSKAKLVMKETMHQYLWNGSEEVFIYVLSKNLFASFKHLYTSLKEYDIDCSSKDMLSLWADKVLEMIELKRLQDVRTLLSIQQFELQGYIRLFQKIYEQDIFEVCGIILDNSDLRNQLKEPDPNKFSYEFRKFDEIMIKAVFSGKPKVVKLFIDNGFNANAIFNYHSALSWAEALDYKEICIILREAGGNPQNESTISYSMLQLVVQYTLDTDCHFTEGFDPLPLVHRLCQVNHTKRNNSFVKMDMIDAFSAAWVSKQHDVFHYLLLKGTGVLNIARSIFRMNQYEKIPQLIYHLITTNTSISINRKQQLFFLMYFKGTRFKNDEDLDAIEIVCELSDFIQTYESSSDIPNFRYNISDERQLRRYVSRLNESKNRIQSLSYLTRHVLRQHFKGVQYQMYLQVKQNEIPKKLMEYLQMKTLLLVLLSENEFNSFEAKVLPARKLFNLL